MKRFLSTLTQDFVLAYRSGHIFITALLLVIMAALILFLPKDLKTHNELTLDTTLGGELASYLRERGINEKYIFQDRDAFDEGLNKDPGKVGVVYSGSLQSPEFEIITQNEINDENLNLLIASLDRAILEIRGDARDLLEVSYLRPLVGQIPFNLQIIPVVIVFEVVLLGFLIVAVMLFQEKQEATMRAYRITPAGAINYILSKTALFIFLSIAYGLPLLIIGFGLSINYGLALLMIVLSSCMMTLFSLAIAVYFRSLSEWFFVGVIILIINFLPMISYSLPSFAPGWLTWIPSYPLVFSVRDILFYNAGWVQIQNTVIYMSILTVIAFSAAFYSVNYILLKEGRQ